MTNIEKAHIVDRNNLSDEFYFASILEEAHDRGFLSNSDIENIQMQCIQLLAYKSEKYNDGLSSSIRVEVAQSIMNSNLYTVGLYLKSLPDAESAINELKSTMISEMYQKGRKLINAKIGAAKHIYEMVKKNKLDTLNYTYNATLDDEGIGSFFEAYKPDYEAHEAPANIDYQLCNDATYLVGVEFIQKYLESVYLENEFCRNFTKEDIHYILCGYDEGYKDLLINIFEHVLTAALGCSFANRSVRELNISAEEVQQVYNELSKDEDGVVALKLTKASQKVLEELNITSVSLQRYIEKSLPKITANIICAIRTNTLDKTFVIPINPDLKPKVEFLPGTKMEDEEYRKLINELLMCRYSSDKLALIRERVESFGDFEDILFDAGLSEEETASVIDILGDLELAALIKRHPFKTEIEAVDLSQAEQTLRLYLNKYVDQLPIERKEQILKIMNHLDC